MVIFKTTQHTAIEKTKKTGCDFGRMTKAIGCGPWMSFYSTFEFFSRLELMQSKCLKKPLHKQMKSLQSIL